MTENYQPRPDDTVLLLIRAKARAADGYPGSVVAYEIADSEGVAFFSTGCSSIVRVEPAPRDLPTQVGSMIVVRNIRGWRDETLLLRLDDVSGEQCGGRNPGTSWVISGGGDWVKPADIGPDWVEIDPQTLRPVEVPS